MLKAIIFDLDDTLYDYKSLNEIAENSLCQYVCKKLSISKDKFYETLKIAKEKTKIPLKNTASSHNRIIYFQKFLEILGYNPFYCTLNMYKIYWGQILDNIKLNPGVLELLKFCKINDIKVGICSDLTTYIQHKKIKKLKIDKYIDAIVTSEECGVEKPNKQMFLMILKKLNVLPSECIFFGDSIEKDINGSNAVGIKGIQYTDNLFKNYNYFNLKKILEM